MSEQRSIYRALVRATGDDRPIVLATIVRARGSTPRDVGSKMLIDPRHGSVGTVGGGCGEAEVVAEAEKVSKSGRANVIRVDLTEDALSWSPAICGGVFDVLLEPWPTSGD